MKPVLFNPEAKAELDAAVAYYDGQRQGLGSRFRDAIDDAVVRIHNNPRAFPSAAPPGFRKCVIQGFPYSLFFEELDEHIRIMAVAHHKRQQGYWWRRLPP